MSANVFKHLGFRKPLTVEILAIVLLILSLVFSATSRAFDTTTNSTVFAMVEQSDGKVIVAGSFTAVLFEEGGVAFRNRIVRLLPDGSLDESFDVGTGANGGVFALALQDDGRILIGGDFTQYNGTVRNRLARLNEDGSLDTTFATGSGFNGPVLTLAVQADGKILAGGSFDTVRANSLNNIARLLPDSSVDLDFDPGDGANETVRAIDLQADQKIVLGGDFTTVDGASRGSVARLNSDGGLDSGLGVLGSANNPIRELIVQPDGKVLVAGDFTTVGVFVRNRIARLLSSGSVDTAFDTGTGANALIDALALQADGKIIIGGAFTTLRGGNRNRLARLNANSSVDTSFNSGANDVVSALLALSSGRIMVGGFFANIDNQNKAHLARLLANGQLDTGPQEDLCVPIRVADGSVAVVCL